MALVPHYMLQGKIDKIKTIKEKDFTETWYQDENGNRSIIIVLKKRG